MNERTNSHILVQEFEYLEPTSVREASALLSQYGDRVRVMAGGTDLIVQMKMERLAPEYLINIRRIPGLEGVALQADELHIGARTPIRVIRDNPQIRAHYLALAEACAAFGSTQIQMMATLGGNLCNGSPASDTVPALMALDAQLVLIGPAGERVVPVEGFFLRPGKTALRGDELLLSVQLQRPQPGTGSAFTKVARVVADLAKASAAAVLVREGERVVDCRLAFGSVAPTVLRVRKAEEMLVGSTFSSELALEAGRVASQEISPIDDLRSSAWYRREVVKAITHDALCLAWERAKQEQSVDRAEEYKATALSPSGEEAEAVATLRVGAAERHLIRLTVNGVEHQLQVAANELLLNVLREQLGLTGSKYGCGIGECGACTVHLNGRPALSCLVLAISADGSNVVTVEGLQKPEGELDPLQKAFIEHAAFQCGYCTPGMLMMSKSLLNENPSPTEDEIRDWLKANRCRCTGFASIVRAVMSRAHPQATDDTRG